MWDTVPAQHDKRPRQKGSCEEVLSPVSAPHPWRPAIANAGLIESFMWDILWDIPKHRVPKLTSAQAIGLIVVNPPSEAHVLNAELVIRIDEIIRQRGLKQVEAAKLLGLSRPDVSRLLRGSFREYSVERLLRLLMALGHDVEIVI